MGRMARAAELLASVPQRTGYNFAFLDEHSKRDVRRALLKAIAERARQDCPVCCQSSQKIPSRISLGGQASPGRSMEQMPQTWRGTYGGNPEYLGQLRRQWSARRKLEDKYPELRGDRRPVHAHEGRYHAHPLRAGDPLPDSKAPKDP